MSGCVTQSAFTAFPQPIDCGAGSFHDVNHTGLMGHRTLDFDSAVPHLSPIFTNADPTYYEWWGENVEESPTSLASPLSPASGSTCRAFSVASQSAKGEGDSSPDSDGMPAASQLNCGSNGGSGMIVGRRRETRRKKQSHNVIEKRYRSKVTGRIDELKDTVPTLRALTRKGSGEDPEDLDGLAPASKLNKATVLAKATEYIKHLEKKQENCISVAEAENSAVMLSQAEKRIRLLSRENESLRESLAKLQNCIGRIESEVKQLHKA